jgi:hypothetical protein
MVTAVLALIGRMRDLNTELVAQLAHLRRARPRSESLDRLERQLVLPLDGLVPYAVKPKDETLSNDEKKKRRGRHPGRNAPPAHLPRVPVFNRVPPERTGSLRVITSGRTRNGVREVTVIAFYGRDPISAAHDGRIWRRVGRAYLVSGGRDPRPPPPAALRHGLFLGSLGSAQHDPNPVVCGSSRVIGGRYAERLLNCGLKRDRCRL